MSSVGDYLRHKKQNLIVCSPDDTIRKAAELMSSNRIGAMPVLSEDFKVVGMISERDIVRAFALHSATLAEKTVSEFMTREVITCNCDTPISSAMETMSHNRIRHLPVFDRDRFVGVISIGDTLAVQLQNLQLEANVLRDISIAARAR